MLAGNLDGLRFEVGTGVEEFLGDDDDAGAAVGGRAALELGEWGVDHAAVLDLGEGVLVLELGVGVFAGVKVVDAGYFGEVLEFGAVSVHAHTQKGMSLAFWFVSYLFALGNAFLIMT